MLIEQDVYTEASFRVCRAINEYMAEISGEKDNCFKTLSFLKFYDDNGEEKCKVNAYGGDEEPEIYGKEFNLKELRNHMEKEIPVYFRPFYKKRNEPIIYIGEKKIKREYKNPNNERPTKLHVAIPCTIDGDIAFIIQITSYVDLKFSKSRIRELIDNNLTIFTFYLKIVYMHQNQFEKIGLHFKNNGECHGKNN